MAYLKLLLSSSLIFIVTTLVVAEVSIGLKKDVTPEHYNIKFATYINDNKFYGECNVSIRIHEPTYNINLYSDKLCVMDIVLIDYLETSDENKEINVYKPKYFNVNKTDILHLYFTNKILSGHYILNMKFMGTMDNYEGIRIFNKKKYENIALTASDFERYGARQIFPCWDEPSFHATFNISVVHHRNYKVLSNMPVKRQKLIENGMLWTHFNTTPLMPTYLVAVVIISKRMNLLDIYSKVDNITIWCRSVCSPYISYAHGVINFFTQNLQNDWSNSTINSKVNHVIIRNFHDRDVINMGLIYYRESDIMYDESLDPLATKIKITRLVGHKMAQVWFPNVFNTSLCNTPWLYEAFVSYFGMYVINKKFFENIRMMDLFVVQIQHEVFRLDVDYNNFTSQNNNFSLEILPSLKGAVLLRMIQHALGKKSLWYTMSLCINDHTYRWKNNYDFWTVMKNAYVSGLQQKPLTQEDFDSKMRKTGYYRFWMEQKLYVLNVTRNYSAGASSNIVTIEILNTTKANLYIPVTYTTQTRLDFDNTVPDIWLPINNAAETQEARIKISDLNSTDWIIFNLQQTEYCRVNYDDKNWHRITKFLKSWKYKKIHVLNRAQLITDAYHLMAANQLNPSKFWNLVYYLRRELDYVAWHPMFKALEYMSSIFLLAKYDERVNSTATKVRNMMHKMLVLNIKYTETPDEDKLTSCLREEVVKWTCLFGHQLCLARANSILREHLDNPKTNKIKPWWKKWTFCNGLAMSGSNSLWTKVYNMWMNNADHEISSFLACAQNVPILITYLSTLTNFTNANPEDYYLRLQVAKNFLSTIAKHVANQYIRQHLLFNIRTISSGISRIVTFTVIINHLYTEQQLDELHDYITDNIYNGRISFHSIIMKVEDTKRNNSTNIYSEEHKRSRAEYLKIDEKIKIRRAEIKNLNKYVQIFCPKKEDKN